MKILTLSNYYPEHTGGIEYVALNLVTRWRRNHQVRWMASDVMDRPHARAVDDLPMAASNFTEVRLGFPYPIPSGRAVSHIFQQAKWCDLVHIHDCLYLASQIAFLASRSYHKPIVVTQHVALVPYVQAYKNTLQKTAYRTLGRLILEHAERVVFISQRVRNWFEKRMHFLHEAAFIPNGVDRGIFYPPTAAERETSRVRLGFSPDDFVLLFVGRFTEKKGLHLVREIAQARPHLRWLMIGSGQIDPRAWDLSNVTVLSPQSQAGLRELYLAADLFALPSVGEGFPLAVQEALSCGLPVAVSEEIANHLPDAPLVRLDIAALPILLETLDGLFATREQLSNLGRAAAEYAKRWDWAGVARQYEGLFIELTTSH